MASVEEAMNTNIKFIFEEEVADEGACCTFSCLFAGGLKNK